MNRLSRIFIVPMLAFAFEGKAQEFSETVCLGPDWIYPYPETCFEVDTEFVGGKRLDEYTISKPGVLAVDYAVRRAELLTFEPKIVNHYCADFRTESSNMPSITAESAHVYLVSELGYALGTETSSERAYVTLRNVASSSGIRIPEVSFMLSAFPEVNDMSFDFDRSFLEPNQYPEFTDSLNFHIDFDNQHSYLYYWERAENRYALIMLPEELRELIFSIIYYLPSIFQEGVTIDVAEDSSIETLVDQNSLVSQTELFRDHAFEIPVIPPVLTLTCDLYGSVPCEEDPEMTEFRDLIANQTAHFLGTGNQESARYVIDNLVAWAQANAMLDIVGIEVGQPGQADFRPRYEISFVLMQILQSWSIMLQANLVTPDEKAIVENWLEEIVTFAAVVPQGGGEDHNFFNVGYFELAVAAAWGIIKNDDALFQMGIERIWLGLHQMSEDGVFPRDVARGKWAMHYQNIVMLSLFYLADLAVTQGYDPFSWSPPGSDKTLHDAVNFVVRSIEDPELVEQYASQYPYDPPPPVNLLTTTLVDSEGRYSRFAHGTIQSSWMSSYIRRFPDHPNTPRLKNILEIGLEQSQPLYNPQSGGNTTCMHASPYVIGPDVEPKINPGHAGVWFNPATSGQGLLLDLNGAGRFMFLAWFAYTEANSDDPNEQHWLTAQGNYNGSRAVLPVYDTLGGKFDDPAPVKSTAIGTIEINFQDCSNGQASYTIDKWGVTGSFPLTRAIPGDEKLCSGLSGAPYLGLVENDARDGAWYNPATPGQGFLVDVQPIPEGDDFIFIAWFTYGEKSHSGQRWLTAQGALAGTKGILPVYETTGGSFNDPTTVNSVEIGSMNIEFSSCNNATLTYVLANEGVEGSIEITRILPGIGSLCEELPAE